MKRLDAIWAVLGAAIVAAIIYLSTARVDLPSPGEGSDKIEHALAYGVLTWWWSQIVVSPRRRAVLLVAGVTLGIALEITQSFIPYRSAEVLDAVADAVGVLVGWALAPPRTLNMLAWIRNWTGASS
jgi:VanZ family protein